MTGARSISMYLATALAALALMAGCATTPEEQPAAPVTEGGGAAAGAKGGAGGPQVGSVPPGGVSAQPLGGAGQPGAELKQGVLAQRSIYYDFDQYDVRDQYRPMLEAHAKYLRQHPDAHMLIQGNTDERGSREYNVALGQRRADNVKHTLVLLGANENQIEAVSLGEEKPKAEGHDEEAWAQNRRSDLLYKGEY